MLAWLFGLNEEKARSLKWLFLVGIFDILSGLIRLFSEMTHGSDDPARHSLRRFGALLSAGFHPEQAAAILAQGAANSPAAIPPAKVLRPGEELPALDTGAKVLEDGLAILHKGERVLNVAAVEALEKLHPGLLDRANAGVPVGTIEPANGSNKPDNGTIKPKSIKRGGTLEPQAVRQRFDTTSEPGTVRHRYDYVKALILDGKLKGEINPRRIRDIPYNGTRMGHAPAKRFYHQLVKEGVIKDESGN